MSDVSVCEACRKSEYRDGVKLKRCGKCKNVFYCGADCQRADWKAHSFHCRKPDAELRKEKQGAGFMGIPGAVNVPVDVDPETGDFDARPLIERIKADQQQVGRAKVTEPPKPKASEHVLCCLLHSPSRSLGSGVGVRTSRHGGGARGENGRV